MRKGVKSVRKGWKGGHWMDHARNSSQEGPRLPSSDFCQTRSLNLKFIAKTDVMRRTLHALRSCSLGAFLLRIHGHGRSFGVASVRCLDGDPRRHPGHHLVRDGQLPPLLRPLPGLAPLPHRRPIDDVVELGLVEDVHPLRPRGQSSLGGHPLLLGRHSVRIVEGVPVVRKLELGRVRLVVLLHHEALRQGEEVGGEPVDGEARGNLQREEADEEGEELEDELAPVVLLLLLVTHAFRVDGGGEGGHGELLAEDQDERHGEEAEGGVPPHAGRGDAVDGRPSLREPLQATVVGGADRPLQGRDPEEGLVDGPILGEAGDGPVQAQEDGELDQGEAAPGQGVLVGILEELGGGLVHHVLVVLELLLDLVLVGLERLHVLGRLALLHGEGDEEAADSRGEEEDGRPPGLLDPDALEGFVHHVMHLDERPLHELEVRVPPPFVLGGVVGRCGRVGEKGRGRREQVLQVVRGRGGQGGRIGGGEARGRQGIGEVLRPDEAEAGGGSRRRPAGRGRKGCRRGGEARGEREAELGGGSHDRFLSAGSGMGCAGL